MTNYYELLGITPQATNQEIHDGYLKSLHDFRESLSQPIHADHTKVGLLEEAYKSLSDPMSRAAYDQSLGQRFHPQERVALPGKDEDDFPTVSDAVQAEYQQLTDKYITAMASAGIFTKALFTLQTSGFGANAFMILGLFVNYSVFHRYGKDVQETLFLFRILPSVFLAILLLPISVSIFINDKQSINSSTGNERISSFGIGRSLNFPDDKLFFVRITSDIGLVRKIAGYIYSISRMLITFDLGFLIGMMFFGGK